MAVPLAGKSGVELGHRDGERSMEGSQEPRSPAMGRIHPTVPVARQDGALMARNNPKSDFLA